jgi:hypothetical protein
MTGGVNWGTFAAYELDGGCEFVRHANTKKKRSSARVLRNRQVPGPGIGPTNKFHQKPKDAQCHHPCTYSLIIDFASRREHWSSRDSSSQPRSRTPSPHRTTRYSWTTSSVGLVSRAPHRCNYSGATTPPAAVSSSGGSSKDDVEAAGGTTRLDCDPRHKLIHGFSITRSLGTFGDEVSLLLFYRIVSCPLWFPSLDVISNLREYHSYPQQDPATQFES